MASLRRIPASMRPVASTSTSVFARSFPIIAATARRGLATEVDNRKPAPIAFKQTTVEELHSHSAHEALAGECSRCDGIAGKLADLSLGISRQEGTDETFYGYVHALMSLCAG